MGVEAGRSGDREGKGAVTEKEREGKEPRQRTEGAVTEKGRSEREGGEVTTMKHER